MENTKKEIQRSKELEDKALAACNDEPIEFINEIQNFGALLAFNAETLLIEHVSENVHHFLNKPADDLLGLSIREVFSSKDFHDIANIGSHRSAFIQREHVKIIKYNDLLLELSLFKADKHIILELTHSNPTESVLKMNSHAKWALDQLRGAKSIDELFEIAVRTLKDVTKFDRVKAYKFHPDNSGEIIAEARNPKMDSFLGLRFPAFDIPPKARNLFFKVSLRYIKNTHKNGIKVKSIKEVENPLNLSLGILRGASPLHLQYLRNMGVTSSMSIPIIAKGRLWGLFAHHHKKEKVLSSEVSYTSELIGQLVNMLLEEKLERIGAEKIKSLHIEGDNFIIINKDKIHLKEFWANYALKLNGLFKTDGIAYQIDDEILTHGSCPTIETIRAIGEKVFEQHAVYQAFDRQDFDFGEWNKSCGLLALQIRKASPKIHLYFFRNEVTKKIPWAGNPKKDLIFEESKVRLHPRSSFNHFVESHKGQSEHWTKLDIFIAESVLEKLQIAVINEQKTHHRLRIVIRELNHRIRNILSLVRSISRQSIKENDSIENHTQSLEIRILALARANSILSANPDLSVDLKILIYEIVLPLCRNEKSLLVEGPELNLDSGVIPIMALIFNELATNALKYGALSTEPGIVQIKWRLTEHELLIEWKELQGPLVIPPKKEGFGSGIIRNAINFELGASAKIDYRPEGVCINFTIPKKNTLKKMDGEMVQEQIKKTVLDQDALSRKITGNILILEDDYFNAIDMKSEIESHGVEVVNIFSTQEDALLSFNENTYQLALLDVNLKEETSLKVAQKCFSEKIPFYYITGYGASFLKEGAFPDGPVILKPISTDKLKDIITQCFKEQRYEG